MTPSNYSSVISIWLMASLRLASAFSGCYLYDNFIDTHFKMVIGTTTADSRGCGRGLLDNLRGECGVVTDWTCDPSDPKDDYRYEASGYVPLQVNGGCFEAAIWKSEDTSVQCET